MESVVAVADFVGMWVTWRVIHISTKYEKNRLIIGLFMEDKLFDVSYVKDVLEMKQRSMLVLEKKNTLNNKVDTNKEPYREVYY